jgi:surfeit locus 1 family protein
MPNGYVRHWNISTLISPEKHLAYALQWFGLALVLTVMFIKMALKK